MKSRISTLNADLIPCRSRTEKVIIDYWRVNGHFNTELYERIKQIRAKDQIKPQEAIIICSNEVSGSSKA